MKLSDILVLLEGLIPVLEPIGEQGIAQLFGIIQAKVNAMSQSDFKDAAVILLPALQQFAILEIRKLKA